MSATVTVMPAPSLGHRVKRFMSDYPLVPLLILLVLLVLVLQMLSPGIVNQRWIANTVKFAIPLALLAGCQTMVMLTGGIDLSVGTAATMAGFIVATQTVDNPAGVAMLIALMPALVNRLHQRRRRGRLPCPSAHHDARYQPDWRRLPSGLPAYGHFRWHEVSGFPGLAGHRPDLGPSQRAGPVHPGGRATDLHSAPHGLWPAALCARRQ